jgi:hypothetical protein
MARKIAAGVLLDLKDQFSSKIKGAGISVQGFADKAVGVADKVNKAFSGTAGIPGGLGVSIGALGAVKSTIDWKAWSIPRSLLRKNCCNQNRFKRSLHLGMDHASIINFLSNEDTQEPCSWVLHYFPRENEIRGNTIFAARIEETTGSKPYEYVSLVKPEAFDGAVNAVSKHDTVWLLFAHRPPREEQDNAQWQFLVALKAYGTVTLAHEYAGTPLYKFERSIR